MTNTFKGTKEKWLLRPTVAKNKDGHPMFHDIIAGNSCGIIVSTHVSWVSGVTPEEDRANAFLIASAPEILEMLIKLNAAIDVYNNNMSDSNLKAINIIQKESNDLITRATTI